MQKRRILFLGETYRADAITWMNGLKEFGDFEIVTFELTKKSTGMSRLGRILELFKTFFNIQKIAKSYKPDMVIAERTTSYGFLATLTGIRPIAIAQQGITDLWPHNSPLYFFKKILQKYAFKKANLIHAWGNVMTKHMLKSGVDTNKILELPKGINLDCFTFNNSESDKIEAIVTRSLEQEYKHETILKAFAILKQQNIPFSLTIIGNGSLMTNLKNLTLELNLSQEVLFLGRIPNDKIADYLKSANYYISMPTTEGVSASLFEAMASGCFPVVTDLPGNRCWINNNKNGILVPSENYTALAQALIHSFYKNSWRNEAILENRKFVEKNANYKVNMKKISETYHKLIDSKNHNQL